jgi:hypothetical protein
VYLAASVVLVKIIQSLVHLLVMPAVAVVVMKTLALQT